MNLKRVSTARLPDHCNRKTCGPVSGLEAPHTVRSTHLTLLFCIIGQKRGTIGKKSATKGMNWVRVQKKKGINRETVNDHHLSLTERVDFSDRYS